MKETNDSILRKIQALLNKTVENGATEAEASAAAAKAQDLLMQYNLSAEDAARSAAEKETTNKVGDHTMKVKWIHQGQHDWMLPLGKAIAQATTTKLLFMSAKGRDSWGYIWIGTEVNRKVAEELFAWITGQMYALAVASRADAYDRRNKGVGPKYIGRNFLRAYLYSMSLRVGERIISHFKELVAEYKAEAYVLVRSDEAELYLQSLKPKTRKLTSGASAFGSDEGRKAGQRDAEKVRITKTGELGTDVGPKALGGKTK